MRKNGLAQYLTRFDEPISQIERTIAPEAKEAEPPLAVEEPPRPDAIIEGAAEFDARGIYAEMEERLERERVALLEEMKSERSRWLGEESDRLTIRFQKVVEAVFANFEDRLSDILIRLAGERLSHDMAERLSRLIRDALADSSQPTLEMRGPEDFVRSLSENLERQGIAVRQVVAAQPDIVAIFGQTTLQTRIEEMLRELKRIETHER
jgi:hypothetical protein